MFGALVAGERDGAVMADLARSKLRRKIPDLAEALTGRFDAHHALIVGQLLARIAATEQALADLDAHLAEQMIPWAHELELLQTIPGVGVHVAQAFIAETGADMSRFPSPALLAAWVGVAPAIHESAGRRPRLGLLDARARRALPRPHPAPGDQFENLGHTVVPDSTS